MNETLSVDPGAAPRRGQLNQAVRESLRDLSIQMSLLSNRADRSGDLQRQAQAVDTGVMAAPGAALRRL